MFLKKILKFLNVHAVFFNRFSAYFFLANNKLCLFVFVFIGYFVNVFGVDAVFYISIYLEDCTGYSVKLNLLKMLCFFPWMFLSKIQFIR